MNNSKPPRRVVKQNAEQRRRTERAIAEEEASMIENAALVHAAVGRMKRIDSVVAALVEARKAKGMTAADVARATGMARPNISRLEGSAKSAPNPTLDTLMAYAQAIGVEVRIALVDPNSGDVVQAEAA
jgi:DNA-binding phage protein